MRKMAALLFILFRLNPVRQADKCVLSPTAGHQLRDGGSKAIEPHSTNYRLEEDRSFPKSSTGELHWLGI